MPTDDPYGLARFLSAQERVFADVRHELAAGHKQTHWMWFIFPQLRALGRSPTAQFYGIGSIEEAKAYLAHPILGSRLVMVTEIMNDLEGMSANEVLGSPDDLKFRSSMTLFAAASAGGMSPYSRALENYYEGAPDQRTLDLLRVNDGAKVMRGQ